MTSAIVMPPSSTEHGGNSTLEMKTLRKDADPFFGGMKDVEVYTFKWQEKVFSQVGKAHISCFNLNITSSAVLQRT